MVLRGNALADRSAWQVYSTFPCLPQCTCRSASGRVHKCYPANEKIITAQCARRIFLPQITTMLFIEMLLGVVLAVAMLLLLLYLIEPSLMSLPFTFFLKWVYKNPPYLDLDKYFPEHKLLEAHADEIRSELEEILKNETHIPRFHEIDKIQTRISNVGTSPWRVFV